MNIFENWYLLFDRPLENDYDGKGTNCRFKVVVYYNTLFENCRENLHCVLVMLKSAL